MNILICGGRRSGDFREAYPIIARLTPNEDLLIHGGCRDRETGRLAGADGLADRIARSLGVHVAVVDALWDNYGPGAGPLRNQAMLHLHPDKVIAFPGGRGTENCVKQAEALGIPVERIGGKDGDS